MANVNYRAGFGIQEERLQWRVGGRGDQGQGLSLGGSSFLHPELFAASVLALRAQY